MLFNTVLSTGSQNRFLICVVGELLCNCARYITHDSIHAGHVTFAAFSKYLTSTTFNCVHETAAA